MAAPSIPITERFVGCVWSLWTEADPAAPIGEAATKTQLRALWNSNITPANRLLYVRLLDLMDEAVEQKIQAKNTLQLNPRWSVLDIARRRPTALVTEAEKESMADYILRCKSAIRYYRMYRARLDRFWTQLNGDELGQGTRTKVDQITVQNQDYMTRWFARQDTLTTQLGMYNFVSVRAQPRFVTAAVFVHNKVVLSCAYDDSGRIVDRTVRKEEFISWRQWNTTWRWKHDDPATGIPNEYYIGRKCWQKQPYNFVKYDRVRVNSTAQKFTFYMDYCPYGDLHSLHETWNLEIRQYPIPEPFLWHLFHCLAESCLIMIQGSYDTQEADLEWFEIVHRDIKPANIFLCSPDSSYFPQYPTPKLGDFGFAIETDPTENANDNPGRYAYAGTPPFLAPEQNSTVHDRNGNMTDPYKLLSHTNIWTIGLVMLEMVSGGKLDPSIQKTYRDGPSEHVISAWAVDNYSRELRGLIGRCIKYWPDDRISAQDLFAAIEDQMVNNEKCSDYVNSATDGQQPVGGLYDWTAGRERYKFDLVRDPDVDMDSDQVGQVIAGVEGVAL